MIMLLIKKINIKKNNKMKQKQLNRIYKKKQHSNQNNKNKKRLKKS